MAALQASEVEGLHLTFDDPLEEEGEVPESWTSPFRAGELPTRALSAVVVFEAVDGRHALRDLQALDAPEPPPLTVVGRLTRLTEDGEPDLEGPPGPLVRLHVMEWSVEYDELESTVWASTTAADYKLLSPAPLYAAHWETLRRKTSLAARAIALLQENKALTYKSLLRLVVGLNTTPGALRLRAEEMETFGAFVADQITNTDGLEDCRALDGLRQQLTRGGGEADEAEPAAPPTPDIESATDPNKRQRKATAQFQFAEVPERKKPKSAGGGRGGKGEREPEKPQTAFAYYAKQAREAVLREAGGVLSSAEVARTVSEQWKEAPADERRHFEVIAQADRERYQLERHFREDEERAKLAESRGVPRGRKRASMGGGEGGGAAAGGASADALGAARRDSGAGGALPTFPMEDGLLLEKELAYRAYLIASSRSRPHPEPPPPAARPAFVYPPQPPRAQPPAVLPPLPVLPTPALLEIALPLGDALPYAGLTRLLMLWDLSNRLGPALGLVPRSIPLGAIANAVLCGGPIDHALLTELHCAMLRAVARDYDGLDDWAAWVGAVQRADLPLTWPALTFQLLDISEDLEAFFSQGGGGREAKEELRVALATGEWADLSPVRRIEVLGWLSDLALQSVGLRDLLDRRAERAAAVRKTRGTLQARSEEVAAALSAARGRLREVINKGAAGASSRGRTPSISAVAAKQLAETEAEERSAVDRHSAEIGTLRRKLADANILYEGLSLRADVLGVDRHGRAYRLLGGPHSNTLLMQSLEAAAGGAARWERLSGPDELRALVEALHPNGKREGPLLHALQRVLAPLLEPHDGSCGGAQSGDAGAPAAPPPGPLESPSADKPAAAPRAERERAQRVALSRAETGASSKIFPEPYLRPAPADADAADAGGAQRLRELAGALSAALSERGAAAESGAADLLRAAANAVCAAAERMPAARKLHASLAPNLDRLRAAVGEFEERLSGAGACWVEGVPLQRAWAAVVRQAAHPAELAAALLAVEASILPAARSRMWGVERAGWWRGEAALAASIASVATCLAMLDDVGCAWDMLQKQADVLQKQAEAAAGRKVVGGGGAGARSRPPRVRERLTAAEFALSRGTPLQLLEWCSDSPHVDELRARVEGELFALSPQPDGSWAHAHLGAAPAVELRGLTSAEATGARVTAWYEEDREGAICDVPYSGIVIDASGCQSGKRGLVVRFDYALDGKGNPEQLHIGNDDDWLYGLHDMKPAKRSAEPSKVPST